ncbi:hypothetical protein D3C76_988110 [compost metagenome]
MLQTLRFDQLVGLVQVFQTLLQFFLDALHRFQQGFPRGDVVALGVESETWQLAENLAGQRIEGGDVLHFIVEQLDADGFQIRFGREDVDHVAAYPEGGAGKVHFVAGVLQVGQAAQQRALVELVATVHVQDHFQVGLGAAQAVDARHGGDDDRVAPLQQRLGRRQAHLLDVVVDRGVLLDEGV